MCSIAICCYRYVASKVYSCMAKKPWNDQVKYDSRITFEIIRIGSVGKLNLTRQDGIL